MEEKRFRFTEKEKTVLFALFRQYQDIIDIRHRRYSQSNHKQFALRKCWNTILEEFNANPDTGSRSMKQIQKFWLNSKLRKRLPSSSSASNEPTPSKPAKKGTILMPFKDCKSNGDAAYRELAKHCKDEISIDDPLEDTNETHEIEVANVAETYDEQYENMNESYFPSGSETIALKVIDNQLNYSIPTPSAANLVAIPQSNHLLASDSSKKTHLTAVSSSGGGSGTSQSTTYIAYTPIKEHNNASGVQLIQKNGGSFVITSATPTTLTAQRNSPSRSSMSAPVDGGDGSLETLSLVELQRHELELRVREAKLRLEVQEIEKEKAREELIQMREIHRLKIKEMEQRLRNMERSSV